jgi:hypothetical protein
MITQEELKKLFAYSPGTGVFTRLVSVSSNAKRGDTPLQRNTNGHVQFRVRGKLYLAHRLAWLYMTGNLPTFELDHKNRVRHDNRWTNLRPATHIENSRNQGVRKNNKSGYRGVHWHKASKRWVAQCQVRGVTVYVAYFHSPEEASEAYEAFTREEHGEFYCGQ